MEILRHFRNMFGKVAYEQNKLNILTPEMTEEV